MQLRGISSFWAGKDQQSYARCEWGKCIGWTGLQETAVSGQPWIGLIGKSDWVEANDTKESGQSLG